MRKIYLKQLVALIAIFGSLVGGNLVAQNYTVAEYTGSHPFYEITDGQPKGTQIMQSTTDNIMTGLQNLPFAWDFYGQPVNNYRISDNGYITFDNSQTLSKKDNIAIPDAAAPTSAIFAFWDDFELTGANDFVFTYTEGESPNQYHVIQWWSISQKGGTDYNYAAIMIKESGGFEIIQSATGGSGHTGTIGCQDGTGANGTMVAGGPNSAYTGAGFAKTDHKSWVFFWDTPPTRDLQVLEMDNTTSLLDGDCMSGTIYNAGNGPVGSFKVQWSVEGSTDVYSNLVSGISLPAFGTYSFSTNSPIKLSGRLGGSPKISIWAAEPNGSTDQNNGNDTLSFNPLIQEGVTSTDRNVLFEEFTTAPCQYCPDGAVVVNGLRPTYPDAIFISIHAGFGTDAMTTPEHSSYASLFAAGAPSAAIDRDRYGVSRSGGGWGSNLAAAEADPTNACVSLTTTWNAGTREITAKADVTAVDFLPTDGSYRMNIFIVEDSVVGSGSGWDQVNAYNTTSGHPYFGKGNPIVGYIHRDVLRAVPTTTWGDEAYFSAGGKTFTKTYNYTLPAGQDESQVVVVAFITKHGGDSSPEGHEVKNAIEAHLDATETNSCSNTGAPFAGCAKTSSPDTIQESTGSSVRTIENELEISLYPNPTNGLSYVKIDLDDRAELEMVLFNALGQQVVNTGAMDAAPGTNTLFIDGAQLPNGMYHVVIKTDGEVRATKPLVINK